MQKTTQQIIAVLLCLFIFSNAAICQFEEYVVQHVLAENESAKNIEMFETVLKGIEKDPRIDVIQKGEKTSKPVSHLIEGFATHNIKRNGFDSKKFVDSTQIATFTQEFEYYGYVSLLLTSIETGQVEKVIYERVKDEYSKKYSIDYKKIGYTPGNNRDKKKMKTITAKAKDRLFASIRKDQDNTWNSIINALKKRSNFTGRRLFPYRLDVTKVIKAKKDKAKIVAVEHDERFGKFSKSSGVLFTINKRKIDGDEIEEFKILGSGEMKKKGATTSSFELKVSRSSAEKKVQTAFTEGKKVYFSFGNRPYTVKSKKQQINIAVSEIKFPESFTEKTKNDLYTKLKFGIYSRPGIAVLERNKFERILAEKEKQKSEEYLDKKIIDQFNTIGADYILEIVFNQPPTVKLHKSSIVMPGEEDQNEYFSEYHFSSRLYEVSTGEMVSEEQLLSSPKFKLDKSQRLSSNALINRGAASMSFETGSFLNNAIPPKVVCYEILEENKGVAKKILVYGDVAHSRRDKFEVIRKTIVDVNGKKLERFSVIGKLSLKKSKGDGLVEATVKSGGDVIFQAMENGEQLLCTDKPNWVERWSNSVEKRRKRYGQ